MDEREHRIRERAHRLWVEEGYPHGRAEQHWFAAMEMVAVEENQQATLQPVAAQPAAEPIEALVNAGEFPTATDQGEMQIPQTPGKPAKKTAPAKPAKPVAEKPAAEKPAAVKPVAAKPVAEKPTAKSKPAAKPSGKTKV
ncbi:DUF2934 domain-containing protein [Ancylobacter sp. VKM B-3255]|uniref:DUF2934 domain-containing protein n=2 Tax=Ancylobacter radicis TaxID=2836179 RepID=A0ABS5RCT7_9HYPH|nr:DUF2934 domain-containing protein [Ancylobacter radicis]